MIPTLPIEVTCPSCGKKYAAHVQSIIDVGQNPELKAALLQGRVNVVACPDCGTPGSVSAPLLYHDAGKELLLLFVPPELNLPLTERERLTGNMVNALMSTLPPEARKGYFLNPRTVLTRESMIEEILQADGVTKEMLEEQRARSRLLQDLLAAMDDEQQLTARVEEHRPQIDYSFFLMIAAVAEDSAASGQKQLSEKLLKLREKLLSLVTIAMPEPLPPETSVTEVVDKAIATEPGQARWAFVVYNRPLLDYGFFQELTRRIEQSSEETGQVLRQLRTELLELTEKLDQAAREAQESKLKVLEEALQSPDPAETLRDHRDEVDLLFMNILGMALQRARENEQKDRMEKLLELNEMVLAMMQEGLPPELRLVNELLSADYPEGTEKLLQERRSEWDAGLLPVLDDLAKDLEAQGRTSVAERLKGIRGQAEQLLPSAK